MRLGIDCREIKTSITGIGRVLIDFLDCLRETSEFSVILFGNQYTDFERENLKNYKKIVLKEKLTIFYDQIQLSDELKKNRIDVFYSPYPKIPLFANCKKISSFFDLTYIVIDEYKNKFKNKIYARFLLDLYAKKSEKVITISQSAKNDLVKLLGLPEEKIEVVYPSVSKNFQPQEIEKIEEVKKKYNIDKKYILYVGNSNPHKNLKRLIEAYNLLPENLRTEYLLILAGVTNRRFSVSSYNLRLLGYVPDNDLPALYSGAALFVFPSLYEGFGLPPLEALACGCPVVSSHTSAMPEILSDTCLYFDPYDSEDISNKIEQMLKNENLKNELRQKGFERAKLFSVNKMVKNLLDIFNNVACDFQSPKVL